MIAPAQWLAALEQNGIGFFAGVPDSLLKNFLACLAERAHGRHVIVANEGAAVALAAGYHLATGGLPLVYLQNSGLGNAVNPLVSLTDRRVYGIPLVLLIGWRGEPGLADEPQHRVQGEITPALLDVLRIPYFVLEPNAGRADRLAAQACDAARQAGAPAAIVVRKDAFEPFVSSNGLPADHPLTREGALELILAALDGETLVISTTGKTSREVFEYRERNGETHDRDFLTVGSMGHASQVALGVALARPERTVLCLDGDGAVLMHMGALAIIGSEAPANFRHVVLNNGAHDSVGGQPTAGFRIDFCAIARACGYRTVLRAEAPEEIARAMATLAECAGPAFLEVRVRKGARKDLGRPTLAPAETKERLMRFLNQ